MSEKVIFYESMKDGCKYFVCPLIFSTILFLLMLSLTINEYLLQSLELYECIVIIIFFGLVSLISLFAFCYCVCYKIFLYEDRGEIKSDWYLITLKVNGKNLILRTKNVEQILEIISRDNK